MFAFNKSNNLYVNLAVTDESEPVDSFFTDNYTNVKKSKHLSSPYPYLFSMNNNESTKIQSKYFLRRSANTNSNMQTSNNDNINEGQNPLDESYYSCSTNRTGFPFSDLNTSTYGSSEKKNQTPNPFIRYDRKVKIRDEPSIY
ncbi:hypothetical protein BCR36DRAFT_405576, partial [Piromyces finnis]